jgi:hypothetical protein
MYNQINGKYGLKLDSLLVKKRVLPMRTWQSINERSTKKLSFIYFSNPIYVKNKESVLLSVWINDGSKLKEKTFFIKLVDGKWVISTVILERNI